MEKSWFGIILFCIIGIIIGHAVFATSKNTKTKKVVHTPIPVEIATASQMTIPSYVQSIGSLAAIEIVHITPQVDGQVQKIYFADGQKVKKDQPIIQLNNIKAQAALDSAQAALTLAQNNYQRFLSIKKFGGVSDTELDKLKADVESQQAAVNTAKAALDETTLVAPFDGTLGAFNINTGDYVTSGTNIVTIVNRKLLKVKYSVPEAEMSQIKVGQPVEVTVDAFPNRTFSGKVNFISPTVEDATRSIDMQATVINQQDLLSPGMFAHVKQTVSELKGALVIPEQALSASLNGYRLFKIVNSKAVLTPVNVGARIDGYAQITNGLQLGDTVVIAGQQKLKDSDLVSIVPTTTVKTAS